MHVQEKLLRDLVASGGCPMLSHAAAAVANGQDPESLSYEQLLRALRSLPLTDYSGNFATACKNLLEAMRADADTETVQGLAAKLCGQVPVDWGMTSGTTGSSKHFPITAKNTERALTAAGKTGLELMLAKFPLCSTTNTTAIGSSSDNKHSSSSQDKAHETSGAAGAPSITLNRHRTLGLALPGPCEELPGGQLVGSISSVFFNRYSKQGIVLDRDPEGRDMTCRPPRLLYLMARPGVSATCRYYALWLCAAAEPGFENVTFLSDLFAGNMLTAISVLQHHWQEVVEDLTAGKLLSRHAAELPPAAVGCVNEYLAQAGPEATAAAASFLKRVMTAHQEAAASGTAQQPFLGQLLPNLHAVLVVLTGSHGKFWPGLRALIPLHVPVCTTMYAGTEGIFAVTKQLLEPGPWDVSLCPTEQQYMVVPQGQSFFEFIPVDPESQPPPTPTSADGTAAVDGAAECTSANGTADNGTATNDNQQPAEKQQQQQVPAVFTVDELQVGSSYELVITTFAGLPRYRVGDVVRVEGFVRFDTTTCLIVDQEADVPQESVLRCPLVTFQGRAGVVLNLIWEKYDEGQLLHALRDTDLALRQMGPAVPGSPPFPGLADFTVYESHQDESNKHYSFFWELHRDAHTLTPAAAAAAATGEATAAGVADGPAVSSSGVDFSQEDVACWAAVLNQNLGRQNDVYAGLLAVGQVGPASIQLVQSGAFSALKDAVVAAKGISPSQFKMPTVVGSDSWIADFLRKRILL